MERTFIGKVLLWYMMIKEPRLIATATEDKLDIDGVEEGAPALQTGESIHEGTYLIADIYISISMETFEHRKYKVRGDDGNN